MKRRSVLSLAWAMLLTLLAGCQPIPVPVATPVLVTGTPVTATTALPAVTAPASAPNAPPTQSAPPTQELPMPTAGTPTPSYDPAMQPIVQLAVNDLAQRLGIAAAEIEVIEARSVVWPDASMGCPQPGMRYIQVPQDGAFIQLSVADKLYNYHIGGSRGLFLCEQTGKPGAPPSFDELQLPGGGGEDL